MNDYIPNPNEIFLNEYKTSCFIKNVVKTSNIIVGDYTYYDDIEDPTKFEQNNVLFNYPEFGDKLIIGKFCSIASKTKFIMGPANHRISSITTYPFNVLEVYGIKIHLNIYHSCHLKETLLLVMMSGLEEKV